MQLDLFQFYDKKEYICVFLVVSIWFRFEASINISWWSAVILDLQLNKYSEWSNDLVFDLL